MEDAATAEISRSQVWQWIHHQCSLDDGVPLTAAHFREILTSEMEALRSEVGSTRYDGGRFADAARLFEQLSTSSAFEDFLTVPAYEMLIEGGA